MNRCGTRSVYTLGTVFAVCVIVVLAVNGVAPPEAAGIQPGGPVKALGPAGTPTPVVQGAGEDSDPSPPPPSGKSTEVVPPDMRSLPDEVVQAYTSVDSLFMKVTIFESGVRPNGEDYPERVRAVVGFSTAKGGRHRSVVSVDGRWVWTRVGDGKRFNERDAKGRTYEGKTPFGNAALNPVPGCGLGAYLSGWLDEYQTAMRAFRRKLSDSTYLGVEICENRPCWKLREVLPDGSETLYVDVDSRFIRRWTGEQVFEVDDAGEPTSWLRRDRRFSDIQVNRVDPDVFRVSGPTTTPAPVDEKNHPDGGSAKPEEEK